MAKLKRPRNFKLKTVGDYELECGKGGAARLIYLKPNAVDYVWIGDGQLAHLKRLHVWIGRAIAFLEARP